MFQQRTDAHGRPLRWWQSSTHSVMGSEEYHRQHDLSPYLYDNEWDHHPQYKVRIEPELSYVSGVVHNLRRVLVIAVVSVALIFLAGAFLVMGSLQTTVSQQLHPNAQDGKVCGISHTHDGTPVILRSQTDTSVSLRGDVNSQTNCGY